MGVEYLPLNIKENDMIYRWIWCILGIHKYRSLKLYTCKDGTWFKLSKCTVCEKRKRYEK